MDSRGKVLIIATIFSALILNLPNAGFARRLPFKTMKLMVSVCKKSDNFRSCLISLSHSPQISSVTDVVSLANAALQSVRQESSSVEIDFRWEVVNSTNPQASQALKECVAYFGDAIRALAIRDGELEMGEASFDVHTALDSVQSCETALANAKVNNEHVSGRIQEWKDLFFAAFAAVSYAENLSSPRA